MFCGILIFRMVGFFGLGRSCFAFVRFSRCVARCCGCLCSLVHFSGGEGIEFSWGVGLV